MKFRVDVNLISEMSDTRHYTSYYLWSSHECWCD